MALWKKEEGGPTYNHWGVLDLIIEEWAVNHGMIPVPEDEGPKEF